MPGFRIPKDEQVLAALRRVLHTQHQVTTQRLLKELVERQLKGEEVYRVGAERLRVLAIESDLVNLEIAARETAARRPLGRCPVCGEKLRRVRNMTVYGGTVTLGYRCTRCTYWTGLKRRVPTLYTFTRK